MQLFSIYLIKESFYHTGRNDAVISPGMLFTFSIQRVVIWILPTCFFLGLTEEVEKAIEDRIGGRQPDPFVLHTKIRSLYSWRDVAERTERVYQTVQDIPLPDISTRLQRSVQSHFICL